MYPDRVFVLIIKGQEFMKTVSAIIFSDDAFYLHISNKKRQKCIFHPLSIAKV